jgi:hypothetical protein
MPLFPRRRRARIGKFSPLELPWIRTRTAESGYLKVRGGGAADGPKNSKKGATKGVDSRLKKS